MERSKQNKHVVCNKNNDDVDDDVEDIDNNDVDDDDGVDNGDYASVNNKGVDNGDDSADKHLTHLSQAADCCLMEGSKQNKHVVCDKDNDVGN
eukprot:2450252-Ditylum_brightwellii.AAC.1